MERPNRTKETRLSVFVNEQELFIDQLEADNKEAYKLGYTNGYQEAITIRDNDIEQIENSLISEEEIFKLRLNKDQRSGIRKQKQAVKQKLNTK